MAIEPVNERPIFPAPVRSDALGFSIWSTSMIRQLTQVFQHYGFKLNNTLLTEDLETEGGTVLSTDNLATNGGTVLSTDNLAANGGTVLSTDNLAANGGDIPETDRTNTFTVVQNIEALGDSALVLSGATDRIRINFSNPTSAGTAAVQQLGDTLQFFSSAGGSFNLEAELLNGMRVGFPAGGFQGAGTINAQAVYDDGTLLTDYVFDAEIDGSIDVEAYDNAVPDREIRDDEGNVIRTEKRNHWAARDFNTNRSELSSRAFEAKWRSSRKLPAVGRLPEKPSVGELTQALLETCEVQAIHIAKLEARIEALEAAQ